MSQFRLLQLGSVASVFLFACRPDPTLENVNEVPVALPRVEIDNGEPEEVDGVLEIAEAPAKVTLDAAASTDADGEVVGYRWLSGTAEVAEMERAELDAGMESASETAETGDGSTRLVPQGEDADWPDDKARTTVELPAGDWTITLWVIDDGGAVSQPRSIRIQVGG